MMDELVSRLPHTGPVYKNDNKTVYMKIEVLTQPLHMTVHTPTYAISFSSEILYIYQALNTIYMCLLSLGKAKLK